MRAHKSGSHLRYAAMEARNERRNKIAEARKEIETKVRAYRRMIDADEREYAVFPESARDHIKKLEEENRRLRGLLEARVQKLCEAIEKAVLKGLEIDKDLKDWDSENSY